VLIGLERMWPGLQGADVMTEIAEMLDQQTWGFARSTPASTDQRRHPEERRRLRRVGRSREEMSQSSEHMREIVFVFQAAMDSL